MSVSEDALQFFLEQLEGLDGVKTRRMFGGVGVYRDGVMFALLAEEIPYLRVDASTRGAFEAFGLEPFRPFPGRRTAMPYFPVPADVLEDRARLRDWAITAIAAARRARAERHGSTD